MIKAKARERIGENLVQVAIPDPRFGFDFSSFIPDFKGSEAALTRLKADQVFQNAWTIFVTPDNCLKGLPEQIAVQGKIAIVASGGLRRGFYLVEHRESQLDRNQNQSILDDVVWQSVSLGYISSRGKIDLLVTGASVINRSGVRIGKGHGYFDLEWAISYSLNVVEKTTPVAAVVHDCQVVDDELPQETFDTACDIIFTPTQVIKVPAAQKPISGVIWEKLEPGMLKSVPPLQELKLIQNDK